MEYQYVTSISAQKTVKNFSKTDETAEVGLAASLDGNIRTTTLRAFTKEEFGEILNKLP